MNEEQALKAIETFLGDMANAGCPVVVCARWTEQEGSLVSNYDTEVEATKRMQKAFAETMSRASYVDIVAEVFRKRGTPMRDLGVDHPENFLSEPIKNARDV